MRVLKPIFAMVKSAALASICLVSLLSVAGEKTTDGDLEKYTIGEDIDGTDGWLKNGDAGSVALISADPDGIQGNVIHFSRTKGDAGNKYVSKSVTDIEAGITYTFSAKVRSLTNWYKSKIIYIDTNGAEITVYGTKSGLTVNTWTAISEEWTVPADLDNAFAVHLGFIFKFGGKPGDFYLDDFSFDDFSFDDGKVVLQKPAVMESK